MLYIVGCKIEKMQYMNGKTKYSTSHIVEAESEDEAYDKVRKYYEEKDSPYYVSHNVDIEYCNEIIK